MGGTDRDAGAAPGSSPRPIVAGARSTFEPIRIKRGGPSIPTLRVRCGAPTPAIQVVSSPELPASLNHTNIATILVSKKGCPFDRCAISLTLPASHRRRWLKSPCSRPRLTREPSRLPRLHDPWPNGTATAKFRISYEEAPQRIGAPRSLGTSPRYRYTHLFCDPPAGRTP